MSAGDDAGARDTDTKPGGEVPGTTGSQPAYVEATDPISMAFKANGVKFGPCPGCHGYETPIHADDGDDDDDDDDRPTRPRKPRPDLCGNCERKKLEKRASLRAKKAAERAARALNTVREAEPGPTGTRSASPTTGDFPEREFHEAAAIFPMMSADEIAELARDIKANGLYDDIILVDGKIADGRNRYAACRLAGVAPRFKDWEGAGSIVSWVLSVNLHRRHLTDQQRAVVAARAKAAFEAEAKARRNANLLQNKGATESADRRFRDLGGTENGKSARRAAERLRVSTRAVEKASRILKNGDDALIEAVAQDTVSLDAAATVSKLPRPEQKKIVESGSVKARAAKMRKSNAIDTKPTAELPAVLADAPAEPGNEEEPSSDAASVRPNVAPNPFDTDDDFCTDDASGPAPEVGGDAHELDPWDALDQATNAVLESFDRVLALDRDRAFAQYEAFAATLLDRVSAEPVDEIAEFMALLG